MGGDLGKIDSGMGCGDGAGRGRQSDCSLLLKGVQKTQTIRSASDIRDVFINAGIKGEEYDAAWNSFVGAKSLVAQQEKAAADVQLRGVPAMFVNGISAESAGMGYAAIWMFCLAVC